MGGGRAVVFTLGLACVAWLAEGSMRVAHAAKVELATVIAAVREAEKAWKKYSGKDEVLSLKEAVTLLNRQGPSMAVIGL